MGKEIMTSDAEQKRKVPDKHNYSDEEIKEFCKNKDIDKLFRTCSVYIGKELTRDFMVMLLYFHERLEFGSDLIKYLVRYSVESDRCSLSYMERIAAEWHERNIRTVEGAVAWSFYYQEKCEIVLASMGIKNRKPFYHEVDFLSLWMWEYGFSMDMIEEACRRTVAKIEKPDFKYVDAILRSWKEKGVREVAELAKMEAEKAAVAKIEAAKPASVVKKTEGKKPAPGAGFRNFEERPNDMYLREDLLFEN